MDRETWSAVSFAADMLIKATLLLGFAGFVRLLLRRASASLRQAIGVLALGGVLLLPALAPVLPDWKVPVVPAVFIEPEDRAEPARGRIDPAAFARQEALPRRVREAAAGVGARTGDTALARQAPLERSANFGYGVFREPEVQPAASPATSFRLPSAGALVMAFFVLWGIGAAVLLSRLGAGIFRVFRHARLAEPATEEKWTELKRELSERLDLSRAVRFLFSDGVPVAVTAGFFRPLLLLPESARRWSPELRRVVVLHELAHVRRGDWLGLLLAEAAAAIYWFHPGVWVVARQLRRDSEQAADDLVLKSGTKPSVYAGHLLGIIRSLRNPKPTPLPVMGVARPSQFEARLKAILDPTASRHPVSAGQYRLAASFAAAAVLTLGALQPWKSAEASATPSASAEETSAIAAGTSCDGKKKEHQKEEARRAGLAQARDDSDSDFAEVTATLDAGLEKTDDSEAYDSQENPDPSEEGSAIPAIWSGAEADQETGFVQASRKKTGSGNEWYDRGMEHHRDEEYDAAIAAFQKAIELGYKEGAASYNIACGYALKRDADSAFAWLDRAMDAGFDVSEYLGQDDDLESLESDRRWTEYRKKARESKHLVKRRAAQRQLARLEQATRSEPKNGAAWYKLAYELYEVGEYDRGAKAFQQAAELGYREATSLYNTACSLSLKDDRRGALDVLEKAILAGFGSAEKIREDDDLDNIRSEARYRELIKLAVDLELPDLPQRSWHDKWGVRSKARLREQWREAAEELQAYAQQHPQIGRAWFNLGFARIEAGEPEEAARAFEKALELGHRRPTTMYNLACSYALLDRKDQAFDWLFKAVQAGFDSSGMLRKDEDLDNLRGDPRYREALRLAERRDRDHDDDED